MKRECIIFIIVILLTIIFFGLTILSAAIYYIDPSCTNNGTGLGADCAASEGALGAQNNWTTIPWAAGNAYLQKRGTIYSGAYIQIGTSGTVAGPIVLGSYGTGENPIINFSGQTYGILANTRKNYIIENYTIDGYGTGSYGIRAYGLGENATFKNLIIQNATNIMLLVTNQDNAVINNITFKDGRNVGLSVENATTGGTYIKNVSVNNIYAFNLSSEGIKINKVINSFFGNITLDTTSQATSIPGITIINSINITFENTTVINGKNGLYIEGCLEKIYLNNMNITNNSQSQGIYFNKNPSSTLNAVINNSYVVKNENGIECTNGYCPSVYDTTFRLNNEDGVAAQNGSLGFKFYRCIFEQNGDPTFVATSSGDGTTSHLNGNINVYYSIYLNNLKSGHAVNANTTGALYHSTIVNNGHVSSVYRQGGFYQSTNSTFNLSNSILMNNQNQEIFFESRNNAQSSYDYNLYYRENYSGFAVLDATTFINWTAYLANRTNLVPSQEQHSNFSDPLFTNASGTMNQTSDFQLKWNSPAIDAGTDLGFTGDFLNNPIYGKPDIGAFEYQPPYNISANAVEQNGSIRIYSDGKFRYLNQTGATTKTIIIQPETGYSSHSANQIRNASYDLEMFNWTTSYALFNITNMSTAANVNISICNLTASGFFTVYIDSAINTTLTANSSGCANFQYKGAWSEHEFKLEGDSTSPTATFSCTPSSVSTSQAVICTCTPSDSGAGINTSATSYTASPSTSAVGTFTETCTYADLAGNTGSSTATYTVTSATSGGSLPSGSSGTSIKQYVIPEISPNTPSFVTEFKEDSGIEQIQLEAKEQANNVKVSVTKYNSKPSAVSFEKTGNVYRYLQIQITNLGNKLEKSVIKIKVEKEWLKEKNLTKENIAMFKFNNITSNWDELNTTYNTEDTNYHYYNVELNSFSYFAIAERDLIKDNSGNNQEPIIDTTIDTTDYNKEVKRKTFWIVWFITTISLTTIILILILLKKRRYKKFGF